MADTSSKSSDTGTFLALLIAIPVVAYGGWWLIYKAPRIVAARRAELRSPPRNR